METARVYIETYGCQMNVADSEVVLSILSTVGYEACPDAASADCVLLNTCSVRAGAERRVVERLRVLRSQLKGSVGGSARSGGAEAGEAGGSRRGVVLGILGCVAERAREELIAEGADVVCGPDAYLHLPQLIEEARLGHAAVDTRLSRTETYADVQPRREGSSRVSAFVSIMRGCDNFCAYCIVPYTRGRERSRPVESILRELDEVEAQGRREAVLLGQNVNSYRAGSVDFAGLLDQCAERHPGLRFRFTSSHPKDLSDELLAVMAVHPNVARHIHLPVQSGSSDVLRRMNRRYDREWYMRRVERLREVMPDCGLTTDVFCGFPGESDADHEATLSLMRWARFDAAFMFAYSERPGTYAARHLPDDVPEEVKQRRLRQIIDQQQELSLASNRADVGRTVEVLVEGRAKKSPAQLMGRSSQNKCVVFPVPAGLTAGQMVGRMVSVEVREATAATLIG